jgi:GT2 family glycosyltransferase
MSLACSIVVPVHGRAQLTARCLDALLGELPGGCEVIVVDDASPDRTPALLRSYGDRIRTLTLAANVGYARACNEGAAIAAHDDLVFLNNDTQPLPGWLHAISRHARERQADVVGAKLLYPDGSVQHAGVVIGQDGYPHNLYAGLPADHPAVNRSRRLQAVTGACMLVRRRAFEQAGGFDPGYVNSLEDVDLCLRIGQAGGEVHYCHEAVLIHLESASRGRDDRFEQSVGRYRERWRDRARRDDLTVYAEDGLLEVEYPDSYPLRLTISPRLAVVDAGREAQIEALLEGYAGQVCDLLAEVVRLTAIAGSDAGAGLGAGLGAGGNDAGASDAGARASGGGAAALDLRAAATDVRAAAGGLGVATIAARRGASRADGHDHRAFQLEANRVEEQVRALQQRLQEIDRAAEHPSRPAFTASRRLGYRRLVQRIRSAVAETVPQGSTVLVVSRGDRELVKLEEREGRHFPQDADGRYLGHHPRDSREAIARLEDLRGDGADYLVLPATAYWWFDHYADFAEHLRERYPMKELGVCAIYRLRSGKRERAPQVAR